MSKINLNNNNNEMILFGGYEHIRRQKPLKSMFFGSRPFKKKTKKAKQHQLEC